MTMDQDSGLARINPRLALEPRDRSEAMEMADVAVKCGYYGLRNAAEALIILMTGRELGLSTTQSLRGIYVVKGKPMVSADAMVACVMNDPRCEYWQPVESTSERCVIRAKRRGMPAEVVGTFTMADAIAAKLTSSDMYQKYARVMLRHRCAAELVRELFPDVILGIYCEGEIDGIDPRGTVRVESTRNDVPRLGVRGVESRVNAHHGAGGESLGEHNQRIADAERAIANGEPSDDVEDEFPAIDATSLDGLAAWYAGLGLRAEDVDRADAATGLACDYAVEKGYRLASADLHSVLAGRLHPTLREIHDSLAKQHTPAGVVAAYQEHASAVDQIEREDGRKACVTVGARYFGERHSPPLSAQARGPAFRAALTPQPPTSPTGTDAPRSTPAASTEGGSVAPSQTVGAQAVTRTVLDADEAEARLVSSATAWAEHLARHVEARSPVFTLAGGYHKRRAAFVEAGVAVARYEATLAAIEEREGRGPDAARQALDGYVTRQRMHPGVGEVIHLRSHRQIVAAKRTGTEG